MAEYHKYVFDVVNKKFVGEFEEMYKQEKKLNFDSWHQDDSRQLNRQIALNILSAFNFGLILDIGCGKGSLTHQLKKRNNKVFGIDISPTAIEVASSRFQDIAFDVVDANNCNALESYLTTCHKDGSLTFDLVFSAEILSYLENWKDLVAFLSTKTKYILVALFLPENPIGFVRSKEELVAVISRHFEIIEEVYLNKSRFSIIFARVL